MAISNNALASIGLAAFATSMLMASGPFGFAFGVALLYSSLIALSLAALIYVASQPNNSVSVSTSVNPPTHTSTFVAASSRPSHSRTFIPAVPAVAPIVPTPLHTRSFVPGGVSGARPLAVPTTIPPRMPAAATSHTKTFVPGGVARNSAASTNTRTFLPSAPSSAATHTRAFVPGGVARSSAAPSTPTHTRSFIPRP